MYSEVGVFGTTEKKECFKYGEDRKKKYWMVKK